MSQKEAQRLTLVQRIDAGELNETQVAATLGILYVWPRLCRRVREQGPAGLISRKRGKPSDRRIDAEQLEQFRALVHQHRRSCRRLLMGAAIYIRC